jgi:hypothetical protein
VATVRARRALAALALAFVAQAAAAAELGTLFHTPEERARLDKLRRGEPEVVIGAVRSGPPAVTGYVKRSDGRHTVWIDGTPLPASPDAGRLLESPAVRAYSDHSDETLKVERKAPR